MIPVLHPASETIGELNSLSEVREAFRFFDTHADAITEEQTRICTIPASPFGERERAEYCRAKFASLGLVTSVDDEGNCLALHRGTSSSPLLVVSAHLDTVFPSHTDFTITRKGNRLLGPGVADDGCGIVALFALAEAMRESCLQLEGSILFVATVGEEGEGNLRGVRYLFTKGEWANKIDAFLSFDGPGVDRITNRALGSLRYRVTLRGPGGHSWGDFGSPNPVNALGRAIARLASYPAPLDPRTTFNVGRIEGGTSVNSIPAKATMEVDLRSVDETELRQLDGFFRRAVKDAADEEARGGRVGHAPLQMELELIGERPSGETAQQSILVQLAKEATRAVGAEAQLELASTDSNFPISIGIPAITIGAGGQSGSSHTLDEWYDATDRDKGLKRALLVSLGVVGVKTA